MVKIKQQKKTMEEKLNTLRAGVLGSNDGILTVVGVLVSVAAATTDRFTIFIAGLSDLLACAFSMASGEYASVSTQKDTEKSAVAQEEKLLKTDFAGELQAVTDYYVNKGVSKETSAAIAADLLKKKPLARLCGSNTTSNLATTWTRGTRHFPPSFPRLREGSSR